MTLVEAGARRDMGQLDAALRTLELAPLNSKSRSAWVVRLRYAYADTLEAAGRESDALAWFHRTHAIDSEELTDAAERADLLERKQSPDACGHVALAFGRPMGHNGATNHIRVTRLALSNDDRPLGKAHLERRNSRRSW